MRQFSKDLYATAVIFTIFILIGGIGLGFFYGITIKDSLMRELQHIAEMSSAVEIMLLLDNSSFCQIYDKLMPAVEENTWRIGEKLEYLEASGKEDFYLKNTYFQLELRNYLISQKAKVLCNKSENLLLYFYSNDRALCTSCINQGAEISEARKHVKMKVYVFDGTMKGLGKAIASLFNVTTFPTIIINGKKYEKYMSWKEIVREINGS